MSANDIIESYLAEVMRRLPRAERNGIGLELRGLLGEMLEDRAQAHGGGADEAAVLAMLREFGTPEEVAGRYRSPGVAVIPAEQTRTFAWVSLVGVGLQWALTLPAVFHGEPLAAWWLSSGLGAFWWPGLLSMIALAAAGLRALRGGAPAWTPHAVDPERVHRGAWILAVLWFVLGAVFLVALPWLIGRMPEPLARVFAFDPDFLRIRAWALIPLWLAALGVLGAAMYRGRWSPLLRRLEMAVNLAFLALIAWWFAAGPMFRMASTDRGARACIGLVAVAVVLDLAVKLYRRRIRIRASGAGA